MCVCGGWGAGGGVERSSKGLDCLAGSVLGSPWAETLEETPHSPLMIPCMSHSFSSHQNLLAGRLCKRENDRPCKTWQERGACIIHLSAHRKA